MFSKEITVSMLAKELLVITASGPEWGFKDETYRDLYVPVAMLEGPLDEIGQTYLFGVANCLYRDRKPGVTQLLLSHFPDSEQYSGFDLHWKEVSRDKKTLHLKVFLRKGF